MPNNLMETNARKIRRGDIYFVRDAKYRSDEKRLRTKKAEMPARPAIVVSRNNANESENNPNVMVVYLTTRTEKRKVSPLYVPVLAKQYSIAICTNIYTIEKNRLAGYIRACSVEEINAVNRALKISLALNPDNQTGRPSEIPE